MHLAMLVLKSLPELLVGTPLLQTWSKYSISLSYVMWDLSSVITGHSHRMGTCGITAIGAKHIANMLRTNSTIKVLL